MTELNSNEIILLENQISDAIDTMRAAVSVQYEPEIENYEKLYSKHLNGLRSGDLKSIECFYKLIGLARAYLETSSKWDQPFLQKMGETEKIIKKIKANSE